MKTDSKPAGAMTLQQPKTTGTTSGGIITIDLQTPARPRGCYRVRVWSGR